MKKVMLLRSIVVLPAVVLAMALLGACGNSDKKTTLPASAQNQASAAAVGMNTCTTCHTVVTADWLASKHANLGSSGLDSPGIPDTGYFGKPPANCQPCHDPGGDSARLVAGYTGNVPRPVVGCEACHGPGSLHAQEGGAGPIAFATRPAGIFSAQFETCTSCHELLSPTDPATPATAEHDAGGSDPRVVSEGTNTNIITNTNSNSITDTHFATPGAWRSAAAGSLNVHITTTDFIAVTGYAMNFADEKVCSNCHNPHKNAVINREWVQSAHADPQGIKIEPKSGAVVGNGFFSSAWAHYNWSTRPECQRCHTTTGFIAYAEALRAGNTDLALAIRRGTASPPPLASDPNFKPEMLECNGCHTDNRGTLRNAGAVTANYDYPSSGTVVNSLVSHTYPDVAGSNVCMLCHTAREIGDTIKGINDTALLAAGAVSPVNFGNFGFVNSHYLSAGATVFTTSGFTFGGRNYQNINSYRHDQIGTPGAPGTGSNGPCIGCHMSRPNKNGNHIFLPVSRVRNGKTVTITGIASEVCFTCHGPNDILMLDLVREQRELFGEALEALKDQLEQRGYFFADASPYFYNLRNSQGAVAVTTGSAVVTNLTGSFWVASKVTGTDALGIISDRFRVNNDGQYYAIKSRDSGTQITLQAPYTGPTTTNGAGDNYTIIGSSTTNWLTKPDTDATGNTTGKNNMGAAFNFNLFEHDPGAYAHNRYFVKRLIYDSIDWLDDNQLNFSVGTTLNCICTPGLCPTSPAAPPAYCDGAKTYLLPNGVINGAAAERP